MIGSELYGQSDAERKLLVGVGRVPRPLFVLGQKKLVSDFHALDVVRVNERIHTHLAHRFSLGHLGT